MLGPELGISLEPKFVACALGSSLYSGPFPVKFVVHAMLFVDRIVDIIIPAVHITWGPQRCL